MTLRLKEDSPKFFPEKPTHGKIKYTVTASRQHMHALEELMTHPSGYSQKRIIKAMLAKFTMHPKRVRVLMMRVRDSWAQEDAINRPYNKAAQVRRLMRHMEDARGVRDPNNPEKWLLKPSFATIVRIEELLADLQGTREPIRIDLDVQVSQACLSVIANLTPDQVTEAIAEYDNTVQLAEEYKQLQKAS